MPRLPRHWRRGRSAPKVSHRSNGPAYTITDLGTIPNYGVPDTYALDGAGDVAVGACVMFPTTCVAGVYDYAMKTIVPLARFDNNTYAIYVPLAMTSAGDTIVGYVKTAANDNVGGGDTRAVVWHRKSALVSTIAFLDSADPTTSGIATTISRNGKYVAGTTFPNPYGDLGFPSTFTTSGYSVLDSTIGGFVNGIDDSGEAVGGATDGSAVFFHGMSEPFPGNGGPDPYVTALAVSNDGTIIGYGFGATDSNGLTPYLGVLYSPKLAPNGTSIVMGEPGTSTVLAAINDADTYTGLLANDQDGDYGPTGAFVGSLSGGQFFLNDIASLPPMSYLATATAINDNGDVVGAEYLDATGGGGEPLQGILRAYEARPVANNCQPSRHRPTCL